MMKYMNGSRLPTKAMKQVITLVCFLALMKLAKIIIPKHIVKKKNGNGITEPGAGTHAVFASLIMNPAAHWYLSGTQPLPASLTVNPRGQISPTNTH